MDTQTGKFVSEEAMEEIFKNEGQQPKRFIMFQIGEEIELKNSIWEVVKCKRRKLVLVFKRKK